MIGTFTWPVAFVAVTLEVEGQGEGQLLRFATNVEETTEAGPDHPMRVVIDPQTQEPAPYIHVRSNLEALIHRNVFYQLVELAVSREVDGQRWLGVWSGGVENMLSPAALIEGTQLAVSAVPEPETYAMMLAGLGMMGWVARRKKSARV